MIKSTTSLTAGLSSEDSYPQLELYHADDFNSKDIKPPEPIVDKILYPGLGMLGAPAKMGKSYMILQLCYCVAEGLPFMGFEVKRPGEVLYLDLQGTPARTKSRLKSMGFEKMPQGLSVAYSARATDNHLIDQLSDWVLYQCKDKGKEPSLIVIDMLAQVKGRQRSSEDSYAADNRILEPLHTFALKHNICVLTVMHTRKGNQRYTDSDDPFNEIIGSIAQFGTADCAWMIIGKRDDDEKRLSVICRDNDDGQQDYNAVFKNHRWTVMGTVEDNQRQKQQTEYNRSPVVFTLRGLATESGWIGTMKQLLSEIVNRTGEYPVPSPTALQKKVDEYRYPLFLEGIRIEPDGKRSNQGQRYKVCRVDSQGQPSQPSLPSHDA